MTFSTFQLYFNAYCPRVPLIHWVVIGLVSLAITLVMLKRKKYSTYGAILFGLQVFIGLLLLDALVLNRYLVGRPNPAGFNLKLELNRLFQRNEEIRMVMLFNIAVFVPFGFLLCEFLRVMRRSGVKKQIGIVALISFGLSLLIETLQIIMKVGLFEVTDLVLNTVGAVLGALISVGCRGLIKGLKREKRI